MRSSTASTSNSRNHALQCAYGMCRSVHTDRSFATCLKQFTVYSMKGVYTCYYVLLYHHVVLT
jgi:hypothetical protein